MIPKRDNTVAVDHCRHSNDTPVVYWIAVVFFAALVLSKFDPETGFTSLIRFGEPWQERRVSDLQGLSIATVPDSSGYDGQFYAQIALDPLLLDPALPTVLDAPAYRARRILAPATAATLGLGHPWWTLQTYALLNVFCWGALAWLLFQQISLGEGHPFARWIGCMFSLGVLESVRQSLVDLPTLLLMVLAINAYAKARSSRSTIWLALSSLTKESSLLGSFALLSDKFLHPSHWRSSCIALFAAILPLTLWSFYVLQRFDNQPNIDGWGNFTWPLLGLLNQAKYSLRELSLGNLDSRYTFSLIGIVGLGTQTWVLWSNPQPNSPWWRIGAAYSILLIFLGPWVWSGYWAAYRAVLPMTIVFNLIIPPTSGFWPLWILGNLTMLHAVWRFL